MGQWSTPHPGRFTPENVTWYTVYRKDGRQSPPQRDSIQPVVSRNTNWAIQPTIPEDSKTNTDRHKKFVPGKHGTNQIVKLKYIFD